VFSPPLTSRAVGLPDSPDDEASDDDDNDNGVVYDDTDSEQDPLTPRNMEVDVPKSRIACRSN
jgi:hypothetical protein